MKIQALYTEKIPDYALSYLINNDESGLNIDEIKIIDNYMAEYYFEAGMFNHGSVYVELPESSVESYFTWSPAFGLACNVYDVNIIILSE